MLWAGNDQIDAKTGKNPIDGPAEAGNNLINTPAETDHNSINASASLLALFELLHGFQHIAGGERHHPFAVAKHVVMAGVIAKHIQLTAES